MKYPLIVTVISGLLICIAPLAAARNSGECTPKSDTGSRCTLSVADLQPTQFAVGSIAVDCKSQSLAAKSKKKLKKYLAREKNFIPVVVDPQGKFYMADHHHLATALFRAKSGDWDDKSKVLHVEIIENLHGAKLSSAEFWAGMQSANRSYNYDNKGTPDMNFSLLPADVSGLLNDPYRTLSRWVRESCGYVKAGKEQCDGIRTDHPHAAPFFMEFYWGNFFREELPLTSAPEKVCKSMPYSAPCLTNEVEQLKEIYGRAMTLAASDKAKQFFESLQLDPFAYGYNSSGEHLALEWRGDTLACEEPVIP